MRPERVAVARVLDPQPLTPRLGARIEGFDLAAEHDEATIAVLRDLLVERGLLVFTGQHKLTPAAQAVFAARFGPIELPPAGMGPAPGVVRLVHGSGAPPTENVWHSDQSFRSSPPLGALLRAVELPPVGGDTIFADMRRAWEALPPALQAIVEPLYAEHDIARCAPPERRAELHAAMPPIGQPVVRIHPESGEKLLFVNPAYTTRLLDAETAGLGETDAAALLGHLLRQVAVPEIQCRIRWEPGMAVLWDNRALQHYAVGDYMPMRRVMDRVSIAGDAVIGPGQRGRRGISEACARSDDRDASPSPRPVSARAG